MDTDEALRKGVQTKENHWAYLLSQYARQHKKELLITTLESPSKKRKTNLWRIVVILDSKPIGYGTDPDQRAATHQARLAACQTLGLTAEPPAVTIQEKTEEDSARWTGLLKTYALEHKRELTVSDLEVPSEQNGNQWHIIVRLENERIGTGHHRSKSRATSMALGNACQKLKLVAPTDLPRWRTKNDPPPHAQSASPIDAPRRPQGVRQIMGQLGDERGRRSEEYVFQAFAELPANAPRWFLGLEHPTREQDAKKIDAIVLTHDAGKIFIQIKSSQAGKMRFHEQGYFPDIVLIVVHAGHTPEAIRQMVFSLVGQMRKKILTNRNPNPSPPAST